MMIQEVLDAVLDVIKQLPTGLCVVIAGPDTSDQQDLTEKVRRKRPDLEVFGPGKTRPSVDHIEVRVGPDGTAFRRLL
jgi:hypothetical protein